jgi:hypothetical protein
MRYDALISRFRLLVQGGFAKYDVCCKCWSIKTLSVAELSSEG